MSRTLAWISVLSLWLCLSAATAGAGKPVFNFKDGVTTRADEGLPFSEMGPYSPRGQFFTYTYTFVLYLDDASSATIQFTYWKVYNLSRHGLLFSFIDRGERQYLQKPIFESSRFRYQPDPPELRLGRNFFRYAPPEVRLHLDLPAEGSSPAMKADLLLAMRTPGWRPGRGPVHYGSPDGDWYDLVVPVPWADVSGTVTIAEETRKVKGWGYCDHNTQTVLPTKQLGWIIALRSFGERHSINFLEYNAPAEYGRTRTTWILVMRDRRILYATDQWEREVLEHRTDEKTGYRYPVRVAVRIDQPGIKLEGEIRGERLIEVIEPLEELPEWVLKVAKNFFTAPAMIRQNAAVDWRLTMPGEGIDEKFTLRGVFENTIVE